MAKYLLSLIACVCMVSSSSADNIGDYLKEIEPSLQLVNTSLTEAERQGLWKTHLRVAVYLTGQVLEREKITSVNHKFKSGWFTSDPNPNLPKTLLDLKVRLGRPQAYAHDKHVLLVLYIRSLGKSINDDSLYHWANELRYAALTPEELLKLKKRKEAKEVVEEILEDVEPETGDASAEDELPLSEEAA